MCACVAALEDAGKSQASIAVVVICGTGTLRTKKREVPPMAGTMSSAANSGHMAATTAGTMKLGLRGQIAGRPCNATRPSEAKDLNTTGLAERQRGAGTAGGGRAVTRTV